MRTINRTALMTCNIPLLPNQKYVSVKLLTGEILHFVSELKGRCQTVFEQVCNYLGLNDAELFSLAIKQDNEYIFVEQALKLYKYAPKSWKTRDSGLDECGKPLLVFYLRVQLYVDCHLLISDKVARHHYYLQIRENISSYCLQLSNERAFLLAAYALQADLGNFNSEKHIGDYFDPFQYFPTSIIRKLGEQYVCRHAPAMHRDNIGLSRGEAEVGYIKEASDSTAQHNMHFYKMRRKKGKVETLVWLAISHKSLQIFKEVGNFRSRISLFLWGDITKIHFEKKKFEIRCAGCPEPRKYIYHVKNEELAKSLFWLCRIMHQFNMVVQPKVIELEKMELEVTTPFRESYIYSDSSDLNWEKIKQANKPSKSPSKNNRQENGQRISVISSASSNTTSGIVSDKVQGFYESEDDLEIMINSPPQSTTSSPNKSKETDYYSGKPRSASGDWSSCSNLPLRNGLQNLALTKTVSNLALQTGSTPSSPLKIAENSNPPLLKIKSSNQTKSSNKTSSKKMESKSDSFTFSVPKPVCGTYPKMSIAKDLKKSKELPGISASTESFSSSLKEMNLSDKRYSVCGVPYTDSNISNYPLGTQTLNHHRNATRIGVSSLTKARNQRLPLTIYNSRQVGSEPELNHLRSWASTLSTDSEHSLPASVYPSHFYPNMYRKHSADGSYLFGSRTSVSALSSALSSSATSTLRNPSCASFQEMAYPAISPPSAFASVHEILLTSVAKAKSEDLPILNHLTEQESSPLKQSQSQLDIGQLWKTSQDMELPLLTALCNDRSLMMLPKTVPTCSRQRHMGASKDLRRFSCSYMLSPQEERNMSMEHPGPVLGDDNSNWNMENYSWLNHMGSSNDAGKTVAKPSGGNSIPNLRPHSLSAPSELPLESIVLSQTGPFAKIVKNCNGTVAS